MSLGLEFPQGSVVKNTFCFSFWACFPLFSLYHKFDLIFLIFRTSLSFVLLMNVFLFF